MRKLFVLIAVFGLISCRQTTAGKSVVAEPVKKSFKMVDIPVMLTEPQQRAEFLAAHYWDNFDFTDTSYISENDTAEQAFADYLGIIMYAPADVAKRSITTMLSRAEVDSLMFAWFAELSEKYLYDANSPMLNEEFYMPAAEYMVASPVYDPYMKQKQVVALENMQKNRLGYPAADFMYTDSAGKTGNLYSIKAAYTLIFFNNPYCGICVDVTAAMVSSPVINAMVKDGKLKILALYPDKDLTLWNNSLSKFPPEWINAYDKGAVIKNDIIYDLRAIPSLYLLDGDKTVILKDAQFELVERYLASDGGVLDKNSW